MSFFDNFFKKNKSKSPNKIELLEISLNCKFPKRFHDICNAISKNEIILELIDEKYKVLDAIIENNENKDSYENVAYLSKEMDDRRNLNNGKIKIPFARSLSGDQFKYLFFEAEIGNESDGRIFITDLDSNIGQLEISKSVFLFQNKTLTTNENQVVINCKPESVEELFENFDLPTSINYWQKSFGFSSRKNDNSIPKGFSIEQHATNYEFENPNENIAKFEIQLQFTNENDLFYTSAAYEIDNAQLKGSIEYNVNYRIFYYKFFCIIDSIIKSMEIAAEQKLATKQDFLALIEMDKLVQLVNQSFKSINYNQV